MGIDARDLVKFAADIISADASETTLRAAISRSYYGAFHSLMPFVSQMPRSQVCPASVDRLTHRETIERLVEWRTDGVHPKLPSMKATKGELRRRMEAAYHARVAADYRLSQQITLADAQSQLERVKGILRQVTQIDALLSDKNGLDKQGDSAA